MLPHIAVEINSAEFAMRQVLDQSSFASEILTRRSPYRGESLRVLHQPEGHRDPLTFQVCV
jgi:hypothetical protein